MKTKVETKRRLFVSCVMLMMLVGTMTVVEMPMANGAPPVGPGDWIINTTEVYDGGVWPGGLITVQGNVTIQRNGNLTLKNNLVLKMDCSYPHEFHVEVEKGGVLQLQSGAMVTALDPNNNYGFYVRAGAVLKATGGSIIEEVGLPNNQLQDSGIYINSNKVVFNGAEIRNTTSGIIMDDVSAIVKNSDIHDNEQIGIISFNPNALPTIDNNDIYNHVNLSSYSMGILVTDDADASITNNHIYDNTMGIMVQKSKALIDGNTLDHNNVGNNGVGIFAMNDAVMTVTNNTFDSNRVGFSALNYVSGLIKDNDFTNHTNWGVGVSIGQFSNISVESNYFQHNYLGIRISDATSSEVSNNDIEDNQYGIQASTDKALIHNNTISGIDPTNNTDIGININRHSKATVIDNIITNIENGSGIRIEEYSTPMVKANDISNCNGNGIEIEDFSFPVLVNNDLTNNNGGIRVGRYVNAKIKGGQIGASAWDGITIEDKGFATIDGVTIDNSGSSSSYQAAISAQGGVATVTGSTLIGKDIDVVIGNLGKLTFFDVNFDDTSVDFQYPTPAQDDHSSFLAVGWYLDVKATWQNAAPIRNATVDVVNSYGDMNNTANTDAGGNATNIPILQYERRYYDIWSNFTDHDINVSKNGVKATSTIHMDKNIAITVVLDDLAAPFLDIISPMEGDHIANSSILINGTSLDPESQVTMVDYSLDRGGSWNLTNSTDGWLNWDSMLNLGNGKYNLTVRATNGAGVFSEMTMNFTVDTMIELNITQPADGLLTNDPLLVINGTAEDGLSLRVYGNNVSLVNGSFETNITLTEGKNIIEFNATDLAKNNLIVTRTVILDTISPVINITSPGKYSASSNVTVRGIVSEAVTLDMDGATVAFDAANMSFEHTIVNMSEGQQNITLTATDAAGNRAVTIVSVTVDTIPPELSVTSPTNGNYTNVNVTRVNGTTDADVLMIDGGIATISNGTFLIDVDLDEGANLIHMAAMDLAGNEALMDIEVILDSQTPQLTVLLPVQDLVTGNPSVEVRGIAEPGVNVTANGVEMTVDDQGRFQGNLNVNEATRTITIIATDMAKNQAQEVRNLIFDGTKPHIEFSAPNNGSTLKADHIYVKGVVSEVDAVVTINGETVALDGNGNFSFRVDLYEGKNIIVVKAIDKGGNIFEKRLKVTRERTVDLGWTSIALMFALLGTVIGIAGGYAWGKFKATKERPKRRAGGSFEDQAKALREAKEKKESPSPPKPFKPGQPPKMGKTGGPPAASRFKAVRPPDPIPMPEKPQKLVQEKAKEPDRPTPTAGPPQKEEVVEKTVSEPKAEPKEETRPEPKPEPKEETKTGSKPEPKEETKTGSKPDSKKDGMDDDLQDILSRLDI